MGRLIDVNKWFKETFPKADLDYSILDNKKAYPHWSTDITGLVNILNDAESVEAIPKADYENRLKADMVAVLEEILTDFDNQIEPNSTRIDCESIIEQKIDALRGEAK